MTDVRVDPALLETTFVFGGFRLVVSAPDYLKETDNRDHYWLFFMPQAEVLTVGPRGIKIERSEAPSYA